MQESRINTNALLAIIVIALAALIILGTAIALIAGKRPGIESGSVDSAQVESVEEVKRPSEGLKEFKEFGTLRVVTLPEQNSEETEGSGTVMVITPWFSYESEDSAFYEELVSHKRAFISFFSDYFSSHTKSGLVSIGEKTIKEQLLAHFNSELKMGKLAALYFDDYLFFD